MNLSVIENDNPIQTKICDDEISDKCYTRTVTVNDFNGICRICLIDLNLDSLANVIIDDVRDLLDYSVQLKIECPDRLPQNVCVACIKKLQISCEFKRLIFNNDVILKKSLQEADEHSLTDNKDDIEIDLHYLEDDNESTLKETISSYFTDENTSGNNVSNENNDNHKNVDLLQKLTVRLTKEHIYSCSHCGNGFIGRDRLTQHEKTHAIANTDDEIKERESGKKEKFTCNICESNFLTATTFEAHIKGHAQEPPPAKEGHVDAFSCMERDHICQICSKSFKFHVLLKKHQTIHKTKNHVCSTCGKGFATKQTLQRHYLTHTGVKQYGCSDCEKKFSHKDILQLHFRTHTGEKPFSCTVCKRSFSNSTSLARHSNTHSEERPYECKICSKAFKSSIELNIHTKIHTGEKQYECNDCGKKFLRKEYLKVHLRAHTGKKPFICTVCNKSFTRSFNLLYHELRKHSGERLYTCKICPKAFKTADELTGHTKLHTGTTRQYECNDCGKSFSRKINLKVHLRTHTGENPFGCAFCKRSFRHSSTLSHHLRIHSEESPFKCEICGKAFKSAANRTTHKKTHVQSRATEGEDSH